MRLISSSGRDHPQSRLTRVEEQYYVHYNNRRWPKRGVWMVCDAAIYLTEAGEYGLLSSGGGLSTWVAKVLFQVLDEMPSANVVQNVVIGST